MHALIAVSTSSSSIPCPVFFNSDNIPDLLVRVNVGAWNVYRYSDVAILEGTSGKVLWTMRSSDAVMSSSVALRAHHHGNDGALFITLGQSIESDSRTLRRANDSDVCFRDYLDEPSRSYAAHVTRDANGHDTSSQSPMLSVVHFTFRIIFLCVKVSMTIHQLCGKIEISPVLKMTLMDFYVIVILLKSVCPPTCILLFPT